MVTIKSFRNFLVNPDFNECSDIVLPKKLLILGSFLLLTLFLLIISQLLDSLMQSLEVYPAYSHILNSVYESISSNSVGNKSTQSTLLISLISAPILEELQFRLLLKKYNKQLIAISFSLVLGYFTNRSFHTELWYGSNETIQALLPTLYIFIFAILFYFPFKILAKGISENLWNENPKFLFYLSAILFALNHITNYNIESAHYLFLPIILLPYFIYATIFGFVRIRLGIMYSIILHSVFLIPTFIKLY